MGIECQDGRERWLWTETGAMSRGLYRVGNGVEDSGSKEAGGG